MKLSFDGKVSIPEHVLTRELDGELVLLDLDTENYFGLDEVATRMWQLLEGADSVQTAFNQLAAEFDVEPEQLRADFQRFVEDLDRYGLITLEGA